MEGFKIAAGMPGTVIERPRSRIGTEWTPSLEYGPSSAFAYVHSVETGAAVDGPGMRYLLFLAGCHFKCLYCHNPDTWQTKGSQKKQIEEILTDIEKYAGFLRTAGGITLSGGEPTLQSDFVYRLFSEVKIRWGLHTALDTQGHLTGRFPDEWFEPVDLVLLDIKHIDDERHRALTKFSVLPTLDCARRLSRIGKPMWIRHVVLPGWTDDLADTERLADFVAELRTVERVEILPFHQLGSHKWRELGMTYELEDTMPPSPELTESVRECFRRRGITTY